jgi:GNAT superfamily N-acetyltransferase
MTADIRLATPADADVVGDALADAFADYVWTRWVIGPEVPDDERRARLAALYRLEAGLAGAETKATWLAEDDGEVLAVASWVRPGARLSEETIALLDREVPALLDGRAPLVAAADTAVTALRPAPPVWLLAALGTRPRARGKGLAPALVAEGLTAVDADGLPAVLDTSSERNVRLYERCGFTVAAELDPPADAPHVWVMVRPAR